MAHDASASIKAENSLEKIMAHELAVAHKMVMELTGRTRGASHPDAEVKRLTLATRVMSVFQQGILTLNYGKGGNKRSSCSMSTSAMVARRLSETLGARSNEELRS